MSPEDTPPRDRFDDVEDVPHRIGAHRAPSRGGRGWIAFAWAAFATGVLVGLGVIVLFVIDGSLGVPSFGPEAQSTPTATVTTTPTPTVTPTVDPSLAVTVLNGTTSSGLAGRVGGVLTDAGWHVTATANASATDIQATTVYFQSEGDRGAALGVARSLPGARVALTQDYAATGADLTVVLGADYARSSG